MSCEIARPAIKFYVEPNNTDMYQKDLSCFLTKTSLEEIQWINISRKRLSFKTII
jgi:hypothetical protein